MKNIIFDFDSTLVAIEGIDELAKIRGVEKQVQTLTTQAMNGETTLEEVFSQRLNLIQPTLSDIQNLSKLYLKNEGANHTGAHKITHCIGQALIAKRLNKKELIAETGAGQHGVATATVAAKLGFKCTVFMGELDYDRQRPNVFWMEQLGAKVIKVTKAVLIGWVASAEWEIFSSSCIIRSSQNPLFFEKSRA